MPDWPSSLPTYPLRDALTAQKQDNKQVFQPEVGDAKVRRRYTGVLKDFDVTFRLTATQRDTLDTFHDTTLSDGVSTFTATDPQKQVSGTFRFISTISWSPLGGGGWQANFRLRRIV